MLSAGSVRARAGARGRQGAGGVRGKGRGTAPRGAVRRGSARRGRVGGSAGADSGAPALSSARYTSMRCRGPSP